MDYTKIKFLVEDGVALITMSDPATMNAAGLEMGTELTHAYAASPTERDRRAPWS